MKMVIRIVTMAIAALVVTIAIGAYLIPAEAVVQRQAIIAAPPEKVFAVVADLKRFNEWSPWSDGKTIYSFEGPANGPGQKMSWKSDDPAIGRGSMTVVEVIENRKLAFELDFGSLGKSQSSLLLAPVDGKTGVTWGFKTEAMGVLDRWMSLMYDSAIGPDFETGLRQLKDVVEKENAGG